MKTNFIGKIFFTIGIGKDQVFGRMFGVVQIVLSVTAVLLLKGYQIGFFEMGVATIFGIIFFFILGHAYISLGFYSGERTRAWASDPIPLRLSRIEKLLEELTIQKKN